MFAVNKITQLLFWGTVILVLFFSSRRLLEDPTRFGHHERTSVIISEFLVAQSDDDNGADRAESSMAAGWIELHNRSAQMVDLTNWTLTDDPTAPDKWVFPDVTIAGNAYLLIWTENTNFPESDNAKPESSPIVADIELDPHGGFLALYPPMAWRFTDAVSIRYPPQIMHTTYGRPNTISTHAEFSYLEHATPGEPNNSDVSWGGMTAPVIPSIERGFFHEPIAVSLSTETPGADIRYTLDGSTPSAEHGFVYRSELPIQRTTLLRAIAVKGGWLSGTAITHSYIFPADVIQQSQNPTSDSLINWPERWGTHRITLFGFEKGEPVAADYEVDPDITQDPEYGPQMVESLLAIPTISLVTEMANLDIYFDDPQMRGPQSERPASIEFLYPNDNLKNIQSGTGLRIQGGAGRWEYMPKHSFRLFFKEKYGAARLHHKVFDDSPLTSYNTLILRGGVGRSFAGHPNTVDQPDAHNDHHLTTYTRDEWARDSQIAMSGIGSHGTFVHLYLNGLYWGLYNIVERPDREFAADYYGGDADQWFTASHGGAGDGQPDRFVVMMQLAAAGGLADPEKYATMLEFVDPVRFSDYMILNWYMGNRDWPENNWYINVRYPAGRNLFFVWDAENTWNVGAELRTGAVPKEGAPFPNVAKMVFDALMANGDYRMLLADRLSKHLRNDGMLTDAASQARWRAISEPLEMAIIAESARWGDTRYVEPITLDDWRSANENVLVQMNGNADLLLQQARSAGYYPAVEPPIFSQLGGIFDGQLLVEIDAAGAPNGEILYTLDGSDPRSATGLVYTGSIVITTAVTLKARQQMDGIWSALTEARFHRSDQQGDVRITEIMYHPLDGSVHEAPKRAAERYEFIEIQNVGAVDVDLSHAYFEGIIHVFPASTTLRAGQLMVLISDFKAFRQRYPTADFHGIFSGKLSNRGETIALRDIHGRLLTSVTYSDRDGWPVSADGTGDSLELRNLSGPANAPRNWGVSEAIHGSPGTVD